MGYAHLQYQYGCFISSILLWGFRLFNQIRKGSKVANIYWSLHYRKGSKSIVMIAVIRIKHENTILHKKHSSKKPLFEWIRRLIEWEKKPLDGVIFTHLAFFTWPISIKLPSKLNQSFSPTHFVLISLVYFLVNYFQLFGFGISNYQIYMCTDIYVVVKGKLILTKKQIISKCDCSEIGECTWVVWGKISQK